MFVETGTISIALYARATALDYHWALYHQWSPNRGTKYHIRDLGDGWIEGHEDISNISKDFLLIGPLTVANGVPAELKEPIKHCLTAVPYNGEGVTCRTWVIQALQTCKNAGLIHCSSPEHLEKEAKAFGYSQFEDTANNVQPRPVIKDSQLSL